MTIDGASRPTTLNALTAAQASERIASGEITSEMLMRDCLARTAAREPQVQAWDYLDPEYAIAQARALGSTTRRSPLHGIPIGVKDIFDTLDMPTAHGFPPYQGHPSQFDSYCVAALRAAGMVIMGKTVTTEFACPQPRRTRNPRDVSRSPGVSSSGSAAAVADFMVPLALGSQTGGSLIVPASFCGVYGYKASPGALDRAGYRHCKPSLDSIGGFARTLDDLIALRAALTSAPARASAAANAPLRIGIVSSIKWDAPDADMRAAMDQAESILRNAGASVSAIRLPDALVQIDQDFAIVNGWEGAGALAAEIAEYSDAFNVFNTRKLAFFKSVMRADYKAALERAGAAQAELEDRTGAFDVLLMPSAPGEALASLTDLVPDEFAKFWSLMQAPAVNLPVFNGANGLPLGLQVIGRRGDDDALLARACWIDVRLREALRQALGQA
ncbi:MAG: amidase [Beijerinckiaceae bacterium]|nr:amidase [Beijerinckiaceae bacterium]